MKWKKLLFFSCLILLSAGCASSDSTSDALLKLSGVTDTKEYIQYQNLKAEDVLDAKGEYDERNLQDDSETVENGISVSFAQNSNLQIQYFTDSALTNSILDQQTTLAKGSTIYASEPVSSNQNNAEFILKEIVILGYKDGISEEIGTSTLEENVVYTIPEDSDYDSIAIIPYGEYKPKEVALSVIQMDGDQETKLSNAGEWKLGNESLKVSGDKTIEVNPSSSDTLSFTFDTDLYFFVRSYPEIFNQKVSDEGSQTVVFDKEQLSQNTSEYVVELHPYLHVEIECPAEAQISVNGAEAETVKKGKTWTSDSMKYGDEIFIITTHEVEAHERDDYRIVPHSDKVNGKIYSKLTIIEPNKETDNISDNGVIIKRNFILSLPEFDEIADYTYTLEGSEVKGNVNVRAGQTLTITMALTDDDVEFTEGHGGLFGFYKNWTDSRRREKSVTITEEMKNKGFNPSAYFSYSQEGK